MPALEPTLCDTTPVSFASFDLDAALLEGIRDLGWVATRPIQSAVIRLALGGSDLIACAETGTGKTCAFVVPILQRLLTARALTKGNGGLPHFSKSRVLILAPTRELAVQIEDEIHGLAYHTAITSAAVYGGVDMGIQERALRAGVDIIVATPASSITCGSRTRTGRRSARLDEADRMMDGLLARRPPDHRCPAGDAANPAFGDNPHEVVLPSRSCASRVRAGRRAHRPRASRTAPTSCQPVRNSTG